MLNAKWWIVTIEQEGQQRDVRVLAERDRVEATVKCHRPDARVIKFHWA